VGTSSPRRAAQIHRAHWKRGYRIDAIRGNVDTRISKVQSGDYDAIVVALAGLKRLGLDGEATEILSVDDMMPAPCQGCLGLELREDRAEVLQLLEAIRHPESDVTARAERAFLSGIGGDCNVPLAAHAAVVGSTLVMKALLLETSGENMAAAAQDGPASEPELVGGQLAERLLAEGGSKILFS
jgi:hydroxymethylbilane synthase